MAPSADHTFPHVVMRVETRPGHHYAEVHFWRTARELRAGQPPFLLNDFRLYHPLTGQRIRTDKQGRLLHTSGAAVAPAERAAFTAALPTRQQWARDDRGRIVKDVRGQWRRRDGRGVAPCLLGGRDLDPSWLREPFARTKWDVLAEEVAAYARRAAIAGWDGDRRGTTTVYQVSASADDGWVDDISGYDINDANVVVGYVGASANHGWYRFTGVSGLDGATINSAVLSLYGETADAGTPQTLLFVDQQTAPTNPSSEADYAGRTTGLSVGWSSPNLSTGGWTDSPELATLLQELIDDVGPPEAVLVLHKNEGVDAGEFCYAWSYDGDSAKAAKLTIDSSGGSVPTVPWPVHRIPRPIYQR